MGHYGDDVMLYEVSLRAIWRDTSDKTLDKTLDRSWTDFGQKSVVFPV